VSEKRYGVILADPPWDYRNGGNGRARAHYPLMTVPEICQLPVGALSLPDAVLIMWTTWPQLGGALQVVSAWGFEYVTGFPWVKVYDPPMVDLFGDFRAKPTWGTGAWVRGCSEPILIGRRGNARPPEKNWMGLVGKRFEHSKKPDNMHEYAESLPGPYLELFARRTRPGWDVWGNEVVSTMQVSSSWPTV